jgi:hypothetical protein
MHLTGEEALSENELGSKAPLSATVLWLVVTALVCAVSSMALLPLLLLAPPLAIPLLLVVLVVGGVVGTLPLWSRLGRRG